MLVINLSLFQVSNSKISQTDRLIRNPSKMWSNLIQLMTIPASVPLNKMVLQKIRRKELYTCAGGPLSFYNQI